MVVDAVYKASKAPQVGNGRTSPWGQDNILWLGKDNIAASNCVLDVRAHNGWKLRMVTAEVPCSLLWLRRDAALTLNAQHDLLLVQVARRPESIDLHAADYNQAMHRSAWAPLKREEGRRAMLVLWSPECSTYEAMSCKGGAARNVCAAVVGCERQTKGGRAQGQRNS